MFSIPNQTYKGITEKEYHCDVGVSALNVFVLF